MAKQRNRQEKVAAPDSPREIPRSGLAALATEAADEWALMLIE